MELIPQLSYPRNVRIELPFIFEGKNYIDVMWDNVPGVIGYNVYRSNKADVPEDYEKVNDEPVEVNFWRDKTYSRERNLSLYRVTYLMPDNRESERSPVAFTPFNADGWRGRMQYILKEFVRRHHLIINADGEDVTIFMRKRAGIKCPNCYDARKGVSITSSCPQCYGTTFVGGYYKVEGVRVRIYSEQESLQPDKYGIMVKYTPMVRIAGSTPQIEKGDLFLRQKNTLLQVEQVFHRHTQGIITIQRCASNELMSDNPVYRLIGT